MKPYVHGQTPTAKLIKANARVIYLEDELARVDRYRKMLPKNPDRWPAFHTPEFRAEYERELAWAARHYPEPVEVKAARLAILVAEIYQPSRRLAA